MATPIYLVSGDDDTKIEAWRTRLRRRAESASGPGALESFDARMSAPDAIAAALTVLTLEMTDRYLLVDGVETWKAGELEPLEQEIGRIPDGTLLLMVSRGKAPARLVKAVEKAGGEHREFASPKPWEMPKWAAERAREEGLSLDREAAKELVAIVGTRQQRLAREIEKLTLTVHPGKQLSADEVRELAAGDPAQQVYELADAVVAGDAVVSLGLAERLTGADERPSKLIFALVRRLRDVHRVAEMLDAGVSESKVQAAVKMPPWAFKRTAAAAKKVDHDRLADALCTFADLEIELRGGGAGFDEDTAFSLALAKAAG